MFQFYGMDMSPPCSAALVALKLAGVEYKYNIIDLIKGDHMKPSFLAINPNHTGDFIVTSIKRFLIDLQPQNYDP